MSVTEKLIFLNYSMNKDRTPASIYSFVLSIFISVFAITSWAQPELHKNLNSRQVVWRTLVLEGEKTIGHATARIILKPLSAEDAEKTLIARPGGREVTTQSVPVLLMEANVNVSFLFTHKQWTGRAWFLPKNATALQRIKHKPGQKGSYKLYRHAIDGVYRKRAKPKDAQEAKLAPEQWSRVSESFFPYGKNRSNCSSVSDPLLLLYIIAASEFSEGDKRDVCIFNKKALYQATLNAIGQERVKVDFSKRHVRGISQVNGEIVALKVLLTARPMNPQAKNLEAFEFMGFEGDVQILLTPDSLIPIRLSGKLPRLGHADFNLTEVILTHPIDESEKRVSQ